MPSKTKVLKSSFGTSHYSKTSPAKGKLSSRTKVLNVWIPFEEALKLNLAIDECVRKLNSYNRNFSEGEKASVLLAIYFDKPQSITVQED